MNKNLCLFEPTLAAIITPAILCTIIILFTEKGMIFEALAVGVLGTLVVSFFHTVLLGLPAVLLLKKVNKIRWWSLASAGFIVGSVPAAFLFWPLGAEGGFSYWNGTKEVVTLENGIPTLAGWAEYAKTVLLMAAFGAIAGFVFWFVQRRISNSQLNTDAKGAS